MTVILHPVPRTTLSLKNILHFMYYTIFFKLKSVHDDYSLSRRNFQYIHETFYQTSDKLFSVYLLKLKTNPDNNNIFKLIHPTK